MCVCVCVCVCACAFGPLQFRELADIIAEEVEKLGGKAHLCITPVISDGRTRPLVS